MISLNSYINSVDLTAHDWLWWMHFVRHSWLTSPNGWLCLVPVIYSYIAISNTEYVLRKIHFIFQTKLKIFHPASEYLQSHIKRIIFFLDRRWLSECVCVCVCVSYFPHASLRTRCRFSFFSLYFSYFLSFSLDLSLSLSIDPSLSPSCMSFIRYQQRRHHHRHPFKIFLRLRPKCQYVSPSNHTLNWCCWKIIHFIIMSQWY